MQGPSEALGNHKGYRLIKPVLGGLPALGIKLVSTYGIGIKIK